MSGKREIATLMRRIAKLDGWEVQLSGRAHYRVTGPTPEAIKFFPLTPSDNRSVPNTVAWLLRHGVPPHVVGKGARS